LATPGSSTAVSSVDRASAVAETNRRRAPVANAASCSAIQVSRSGGGKADVGTRPARAAGMGSVVEVETDGPDEEAALAAIEALFADKFGEAE